MLEEEEEEDNEYGYNAFCSYCNETMGHVHKTLRELYTTCTDFPIDSRIMRTNIYHNLWCKL